MLRFKPQKNTTKYYILKRNPARPRGRFRSGRAVTITKAYLHNTPETGLYGGITEIEMDGVKMRLVDGELRLVDDAWDD